MSTKGMHEWVRKIRNEAAAELEALDREYADDAVRRAVGDAYIAVGYSGNRAERDADGVASARKKLHAAIEAVYYATDAVTTELSHAQRTVKARNGDAIF